MARIESTGYNQNVHPAWCGDFLNREHLLPGGAKIDPATVPVNTNGKRFLPAGTVVGRTYAERDAGAPFGLVATDATTGDVTDDEVYIVAFDVPDADTNNDLDLVRHGTLIKTNFLPEALGAAVLAAIRDRYETTIGAD